MKTQIQTQTQIDTRDLADVRGGFEPLTMPSDYLPWFMPEFWWSGSLLDRIREMLRPQYVSAD
jgi:hypothetical protein